MNPVSFYNCQSDWPNYFGRELNHLDDDISYDIIGDVHGCYSELCQLLLALGYQVNADSWFAKPPEGRKLVFLGDLCDRGPENVNVLRMAIQLERQGDALFVTGNHDEALWLNLHSQDAPGIIGLENTCREIEAAPDQALLRSKINNLLENGSSYYVLDHGRLIVVHAGLVDDACEATVVYGHTAFKKIRYEKNTIGIDTGCVFGNSLTAMRYPELEFVFVPAYRAYYQLQQELK